MRDGIDPVGEAGHDSYSCLREAAGNVRGLCTSLLAGLSGADHGNGSFVGLEELSANEQHGGTVRYQPEIQRVLRHARGDDFDATTAQLLDRLRPEPDTVLVDRVQAGSSSLEIFRVRSDQAFG